MKIMTDEYTKRLERENEILRERIIGYAAKAECYDYIMDNLMDSQQKRGIITCTAANEKFITLVMCVETCDLNLYHYMMRQDIAKKLKPKDSMRGSFNDW
jgi:hypothetical protein